MCKLKLLDVDRPFGLETKVALLVNGSKFRLACRESFFYLDSVKLSIVLYRHNKKAESGCDSAFCLHCCDGLHYPTDFSKTFHSSDE